MMHGRGKSDSAIVAEKLANNAEQPAAEPVEPRAEAEGNANQQSTDRTQRRADVSLVMGRPPAEADMQRFFAVTTPSVHQMVLTLERQGWISRKPGVARSINLLLDPEILPKLQPVISSVQRY
jgi:hypothetical protein